MAGQLQGAEWQTLLLGVDEDRICFKNLVAGRLEVPTRMITYTNMEMEICVMKKAGTYFGSTWKDVPKTSIRKSKVESTIFFNKHDRCSGEWINVSQSCGTTIAVADGKPEVFPVSFFHYWQHGFMQIKLKKAGETGWKRKSMEEDTGAHDTGLVLFQRWQGGKTCR